MARTTSILAALCGLTLLASAQGRFPRPFGRFKPKTPTLPNPPTQGNVSVANSWIPGHPGPISQIGHHIPSRRTPPLYSFGGATGAQKPPAKFLSRGSSDGGRRRKPRRKPKGGFKGEGSEPSETAGPEPSVTAEPEPSVTAKSEPNAGMIPNPLVGYWEQTWNLQSSPPADANVGLAFSGWANVSRALFDSQRVYGRLRGMKFITIGGGNANGRWSAATLRSVREAIRAGRFSDYRGLAFDVEEGDAGLENDFLEAFRDAKKAGLAVLVTVSHTAPYGISDAKTIARAFIASRDIDAISPQMYSSGTCSEPGIVDKDISQGVPWAWYARSKAAIVPSLWKEALYPEAQKFLLSQGVKTAGYIVWCK